MILAQAASADTAEIVLFVVFAAIALGAGLAMVMMRNIVHAALMLVINFLSIAALYLGLQSAFLAIGQVIVYAGAIMVLFLFVIMLLGVDHDDLLVSGVKRPQVLAVLGAVLVAAVLLFAFVGPYTGPESRCGSQAPGDVVATQATQPCVGFDAALGVNDTGSVGVLADRMFGRYTFPFELAAVLLTVATVGAMLLGRRETEGDDDAWTPSMDLPDDDPDPDPDGDLDLSEATIASSDAPLVTDDPEVVEAARAEQEDR